MSTKQEVTEQVVVGNVTFELGCRKMEYGF